MRLSLIIIILVFITFGISRRLKSKVPMISETQAEYRDKDNSTSFNNELIEEEYNTEENIYMMNPNQE